MAKRSVDLGRAGAGVQSPNGVIAFALLRGAGPRERGGSDSVARKAREKRLSSLSRTPQSAEERASDVASDLVAVTHFPRAGISQQVGIEAVHWSSEVSRYRVTETLRRKSLRRAPQPTRLSPTISSTMWEV